MRILRDPTAAEGGGGDDLNTRIAAILKSNPGLLAGLAPGAKPDEEKPATPPPAQDDGYVRVKREDYEGLAKIRDQRDADLKAERDRVEQERVKAGEFKTLWTELKAEIAREKDRAAEEAAKYRRAFKGRELASAVAGHQLLPGKAPILLKLIEDEFDIEDSGGAWSVVHKATREPAGEAVKRLLESTYDNFVQAGNRGGSGATRTASTPGEAPAQQQPASYTDTVLALWKANHTQGQAGGPVGLGRSMRRPS